MEMGAPPSDGDVAVALCLLVRLGGTIVFAFPLISYVGCLGDIVVRAVSGLMILLAVHSMMIEGWAHMSRFRRAELSMKRWRKICARASYRKSLPRPSDYFTVWFYTSLTYSTFISMRYIEVK